MGAAKVIGLVKAIRAWPMKEHVLSACLYTLELWLLQEGYFVYNQIVDERKVMEREKMRGVKGYIHI